MSEKRKSSADDSSESKKKTQQYHNGYLEYGFIEGQDRTRPECVFCGEKLANDSMKPSRLKRHQETRHSHNIGQSREYFEKKKQVAISKQSQDIRKAFGRVGSDLLAVTEASFDCSLLIAQTKKPHNIGEQLIKSSCLKIVQRLFGAHAVDKVKTLPLSDSTVKDRIDKMAGDCQNQLLDKLRNVDFAIQLDETTTVAGESVLIVYVQYVDGEDLKQDILMSKNLETTTTGKDVFMAVDSYLSSNNLSYENLVACCSDGAAAMMGKNKGFNSRLKEKAPHCLIFHCMLHRQALASKKLSEDLSETLSTVVKVVNFIKTRPGNKRLFTQLCEDEAHQTLLLHTEVRWLSRGKVLVRFMELQEKIKEFLKDHNRRLCEQLTEEFWIKTAYLADMFSLYNETNKRMQGPESNIVHCKDALDAYVCKLNYRVEKMSSGELQHFPLLQKQSAGTVRASLRTEFTRHMNMLREEINSRFADLIAPLSGELSVLLCAVPKPSGDISCQDVLNGTGVKVPQHPRRKMEVSETS
ncbi:SCAN domain-containing protein 3-like [Neoarius graeffei]|uniref:SCAN domain-containing protein 3-like n=1 Tax=Neoarius graeffei TaxID=443677 RepID=UPI00298CCE3D|nr:SCAN domain-containing protein 3-like [Neoarius graeffei]